jgi:hypothetical protein
LPKRSRDRSSDRPIPATITSGSPQRSGGQAARVDHPLPWAADIVEALNLAYTLNLEVAVRAGGHNVPERATIDGGLILDLSLMKGIHVDPKTRIARAHGDLTWNEFNVRRSSMVSPRREAWRRRRASRASRSRADSAGSWANMPLPPTISFRSTLSWLTAESSRPAKEENVDLFWALRGGGGNFGVAASFDEYRVHQVGPMVFGGLIAYPFSAAWEVLRFFRDVTASLDDEFTVFAGLIHTPDGSGAVK